MTGSANMVATMVAMLSLMATKGKAESSSSLMFSIKPASSSFLTELLGSRFMEKIRVNKNKVTPIVEDISTTTFSIRCGKVKAS